MIQNKEIRAAIESFPGTFGLRAFPGKVFRIAVDYCYHNGESIQLVNRSRERGKVAALCSNHTVEELRQNIVKNRS